MSKKMVVVVALAMVMVFAFAGSAFAVWGDNGYIDPATVTFAAGQPHKGYTDSTTLCGICHSVHGATGEKLLQSSAADSCTYCHITQTTYATVYGGVATNYTTASNTAHGFDATYPVECADCHTVHGGGTISTTLGTGTSNLRAFTAVTTFMSAGPRSAYTTMDVQTSAPASFGQWCAGCHPYYNTAYDGKSHVMKNYTTDYAGSEGSNAATQVAWVTAASCENCHDADVNDTNPANEGVAFPHDTTAARFLNIGASALSSAGIAVTGDEDGACLKCHDSGNAFDGVSKSF